MSKRSGSGRCYTPSEPIEWAAFSTSPAFIEGRRRQTGVRRMGQRYEESVQLALGRRYDLYAPGPWLRFAERGSAEIRWCQPDGLLFDFHAGIVYVVEIKLRHTSDAWWQLKRLYEPVLRVALGPLWDFRLVEVVRWYDRGAYFPAPHELRRDILDTRPGIVGVHILNGESRA